MLLVRSRYALCALEVRSGSAQGTLLVRSRSDALHCFAPQMFLHVS